jgi:hypothetical protein
MGRKKIVVVSAVFPPEQVTSAYLNYDLAHELAKKYDVTVVRPYPTRPAGSRFENADVEDSSFKTVLVDSYTHPKPSILGRIIESIDFGRKSIRYIKQHHNEIDFVYNDGWHLFGLYLVARACVKYEIPYIVPIQDIYPECLLTKSSLPGCIRAIIKNILLPIDKYYQRNAAKVRTISNEMANYLSNTRKIGSSNYFVVNNWQNDEDFVNAEKKTGNQHIIFEYVGSINEHANVDMMIKAFSDANIPDSEMRIYGSGNRKETCKKLVNDLKLDNVTFDFVSRNEIPRVQSYADVLLLALPKGNGNLCLPSKLTSYMLSGRPVIASVDKDSATSRIIENEQCGFIVEPDNLDDMIFAFKSFAMLSSEKREMMSNNSRNYALRHLTREVNLNIVVNEINNILGEWQKKR